MPSYKRPGVFVEETLSPSTARTSGGGSIAAFVGTYGRGLTAPTYLSSYTDFSNKYGPLDANYDLGFAVFTYFGNGGAGCWLTRVVGVGAGVASLTLLDRATSAQGTLTANAVSPGVWGNAVAIAIADTGVTGRFNLVVYYGGTALGNVVETFTDLSMDPADSRYVLSLVNSQSNYVTLTNLSSSTAAPNNVPAVRQASDSDAALSGGNDGAAPTATDYLTTVQQLDIVDGPLVLNVPGVSAVSTMNPIIAYCETRGDVFVVLDPAADRSVSQISTDFSTANNSSYAAVYYPRIQIADPIAITPNILRVVPPGGAVVGQMLRTDVQVGPFQAPAGLTAGLIPAAAVERKLTPADLDTLNTNTPAINAIRPVPGGGICVMGARTLKSGYADMYVPIRRSLIYIRTNLVNLTQFAIFEPNDANLWQRITVTTANFLQQYYQKGGLRGATSTQAFYVTCDSTINTSASIAAGVVNIEVGVALQYPAEFIVIRLGQYDGGSASIVEVS